MAPMMRAMGLDRVEAPPVAGVLATAVGALLVTDSLVDVLACVELEAWVVVEFFSGVGMAPMDELTVVMLPLCMLMLPDADAEPEALGRVPEPPLYWNWPE
jgi:hypothetical protein